MTNLDATWIAIAIKVGGTLLAALVLIVVVGVSRKRHRARQEKSDEEIVKRPGRGKTRP
jgi:uncharacterized membrane protein